MNKNFKPFRLGQLVMTPAAMELMGEHQLDILDFIVRHNNGDWGDLGADDKRANDQATHNGERILSSYKITASSKVWIITEADRSSSCVLLPSDY